MFAKFPICYSTAAVFVIVLVAAPALSDTITHGTTTIEMDFVIVGDPGNANDTHGDGYGAVDYVYRIGKYEVSGDQWSTVAAADTTGLLTATAPWSGSRPMAEISWNEAAIFCNWLTSGSVTEGAYAIGAAGDVNAIDRDQALSTYGILYVIPTEDEWYKAAYYDPGKSGYWDYPTQHDDPQVPTGLDRAQDTTFDAVFRDGYNPAQPNDVDNAGVLSAYGTMGQGGNVQERNETQIGSARGVRGGYWYGNQSGELHAASRGFSNPTRRDSFTGFRVAAIPEPSSVALLVCGLIACLAWRLTSARTT